MNIFERPESIYYNILVRTDRTDGIHAQINITCLTIVPMESIDRTLSKFKNYLLSDILELLRASTSSSCKGISATVQQKNYEQIMAAYNNKLIQSSQCVLQCAAVITGISIWKNNRLMTLKSNQILLL